MEPCIAAINISEAVDQDWIEAQLSDAEYRQYIGLSASKKDDFLAGRIALKQALARYTSMDTRELSVQNALDGQPFVPGFEHLYVSISHSHGYGIGIVAPFRVGIDLEWPKSRNPALLDYLVDEQERQLVEKYPAAAQDVITAIWVLKEAVLKGLGTGLSVLPRRVRIVSGQPPDAFTLMVQDVSSIPWYVWLAKIDGLLIAVAYEQSPRQPPVIHWHHAPGLPAARATQNVATA